MTGVSAYIREIQVVPDLLLREDPVRREER